MAGALSESAPRPVSVVRVEAVEPPANPPPPPLDQPPVLVQDAVPGMVPETAPASPNNEEALLQEHATSVVATTQTHQEPVQVVRSFASTEAQTESLQLLASECELRDARRRERRLHRQRRRAIQRANGAAAAALACVSAGACPGAGLPPNYHHQVPPPPMAPGSACGVPGGAPGVPGLGPVGGFLHPPPPHLGLRGLSLGLPFPVPASVSAFGRDASPKQCCGLGSPPVRWSILGVGTVGLVCAGAGALLGALRATGRDHIAVALLMIGIGVVLVTVSAVAWRVTSRENCGGFFGLTGISGRIPPARPMHPYAAMIYPEFQFRTPPPSYQASMQEYRLRLLLLDRLQPTSSPPPTYRSNAGSYVAAANGMNPVGALTSVVTNSSTTPVGTMTCTRESRPPSYCTNLRSSNAQPGTGSSLLVPSKKDANLVRIVQTESDPVILSGDQTPPITAVEVLAHL